MADNRGANQPNAKSSEEPAKKRLRRDLGHVSSCSTRMIQKTFENSWSIEDFCAQQQTLQPGEYIMAPSFGDNKHEFSLKMFPNGKDQEHSEYVSIYLHVNKCPNPRLRFKVTFTINTSEGLKTCTLNKNLVTVNRSGVITASKFFLSKTINESRDLYTPNDVLTLGCELTVYGESLTWTTSVFQYIEKKKMRLEKLGQVASTADEEAPNGDRLPSLLDSGDFSDFTIVASCGREFNTHMCILSSRSDYFQTLLRNKTTREFLEKRVEFDDISAETLEVVLRHIYDTSGENAIENDHLTIDLAAAVDRLMVPSMRTQIKEMLTLNLSAENIVTRITMAAELRMEEEYEHLLGFFATNKREAMETTDWLTLKREKQQMTVKILEECMMLLDDPSRTIDRRIIDRITLD